MRFVSKERIEDPYAVPENGALCYIDGVLHIRVGLDWREVPSITRQKATEVEASRIDIHTPDEVKRERETRG